MIASSAKSPEGLFHSLTSHGLPNTPDAQSFVTEVFNQIPRKHKPKKAAVESKKSAAESNKDLLAKKFSLLLEDDTMVAGDVKSRSSKGKGKEKASHTTDERVRSKSSSKSKKEKSDKHTTRKRDADDEAWESDEELRQFKRRRAEQFQQASAHYKTLQVILTPALDTARSSSHG